MLYVSNYQVGSHIGFFDADNDGLLLPLTFRYFPFNYSIFETWFMVVVV